MKTRDPVLLPVSSLSNHTRSVAPLKVPRPRLFVLACTFADAYERCYRRTPRGGTGQTGLASSCQVLTKASRHLVTSLFLNEGAGILTVEC